MIMMRSNPPGGKVSKPPPPVPPRPSKTVVAEALAKTRRYENVSVPKNGGVVIRRSPPVVKSQSYSSINNYDKVVPKIDRTPSLVEEPPKAATRTLVYQSDNVKSAGTVMEIKVNVNRSASAKSIGGNPVCRTSSFKTPKTNSLPIKRENVCTISLMNNETSKAVNNNELSRDSSLESLGESEEQKLSRSSSFKTNDVTSSDSVISEDENKLLDTNWNEINDRNHVNTLIDEMFASVLELQEPPTMVINEDITPPHEEQEDKVTVTTLETSEKTILIIDDTSASKKVTFDNTTTNSSSSSKSSKSSTSESSSNKKRIDDKINHELLISELSSMKKEQDRIMKRQRKPSLDLFDAEPPRIQHSDWVEVNNGQEIRLSSCQITIENGQKRHETDTKFLSRLSSMSNLHGLPPLPKSLSGFNLSEQQPQQPHQQGRPGSSRNVSPAMVYPMGHQKGGAPNGDVGSLKKANNLDAKLALLRREMYSLRQLDLSLLSQLWSLNESIQDFRHILQEQDDRNVLSPPSPSPTPSSGEDADGDDFYAPSPMRFRPAPPPPPHRRPSNSSTGTGSSV